MKRFVEGTDRGQSTLFPECLEDWISEDNPVRVIDAFVEELDLGELGFGGVDPEATGRLLSVLLKLALVLVLDGAAFCWWIFVKFLASVAKAPQTVTLSAGRIAYQFAVGALPICSGGDVKRLLLTGFGLVAALLAGPATAADLPVKAAPPPVSAPAYNWTGFYLGGTVGYSVARDPSAPIFPTFGPPFDQVTLAPGGWVGGVEGGYNWQINRWLLGLEADWQWTGEKDSFCLDCSPLGRGIEQKLPWFATVRGRIGYAVGPALFYATGGVAFGDVRTTLSCCGPPSQISAPITEHKTGWTAGGGVEGALAGNWTAKIEYLYVNLGNTTDSFVIPAFAPAFMVGTSSIRDHIFRVGLNYRFGGAPYQAAGTPSSSMPVKAPVVAAAVPYSWTGFYLGGNIGYSVGRNQIGQSFAGIPNDQFTFAPAGWLGGGQLGFNVQTGSVVFGVEGDWQWSDEHDTGLCRDCPATAGFLYQLVGQKLPWFATVRGRVGYAAGPVLFYVTGGAAFTQLHTDYTEAALPIFNFASFDNNKTGAAAGGGIEAALGGNWSAKVEYLYMNFGTISVTVPGTATFAPVTLSSQVRDNVVRIGLNYKFTPGPFGISSKD